MSTDVIAEKPAAGRWWTLGLLFVAGVLNIFDRQIVNVLAQDIKLELHITDGQLGLLTGTAFGIFYAVLGMPLGRLADRTNRIRLMAACLALWSGFTIACGLANGFVSLFIARMGVGVGEAGSQPASTALIPDLFTEKRRSSAMSALLFGVPVGGFLGLLIGGYVGFHFGWRTAFMVAGAPGCVLALLMLFTCRDPRSNRPKAAPEARPSFLATLGVLWKQPAYRWLALALSCSTFLIYASGAWLPAFFIRAHGMTTAEIGAFSAIAVGVGGGVGALCTGLVSDLLRPLSARIESWVLLTILVVAIPSMGLIVLSPDRTVELAAMFIFNICAYGWLGPTARLIQKQASPQSWGLALATCSTLASIFSLGFGLPLTGVLSDALTPAFGKPAIGYALAGMTALVSMVAIIAHIGALITGRRAVT